MGKGGAGGEDEWNEGTGAVGNGFIADFTDVLTRLQYGGSPIKVGEEEYSLFRDHEYVNPPLHSSTSLTSPQAPRKDQGRRVNSSHDLNPTHT